jgi:hypothetical protein
MKNILLDPLKNEQKWKEICFLYNGLQKIIYL